MYRRKAALAVSGEGIPLEHASEGRTEEAFVEWYWAKRRKPRSVGRVYAKALKSIDRWLEERGCSERFMGKGPFVKEPHALLQRLKYDPDFRKLDERMLFACEGAVEEYVIWIS